MPSLSEIEIAVVKRDVHFFPIKEKRDGFTHRAFFVLDQYLVDLGATQLALAFMRIKVTLA